MAEISIFLFHNQITCNAIKRLSIVYNTRPANFIVITCPCKNRSTFNRRSNNRIRIRITWLRPQINFNVKILADTLCMSQPTLYRKVKEHFHLTVTELIRKMRMNKAASLLAMRKYSILEITEMVGYNDYETYVLIE